MNGSTPHLDFMQEVHDDYPKPPGRPPLKLFRVSPQTHHELHLRARTLLPEHQKHLNILLAHNQIPIARTRVPSPPNVVLIDLGETQRDLAWLSLP